MGVQGDELRMSDYLQALKRLAGRSPQLLRQLIESSAYVAQIASAQGRPDAVAELVLRRRLERRWLKSHLGKREFTRRRRDQAFLDLFGWPGTDPGVAHQDLMLAPPSSPNGSGLSTDDRR